MKRIFFTIFLLVFYTNCFALIGDVDDSGDVDLKDAIIALQVCAGKSALPLNLNADVNSDEHLGIEEAVFAIKFTGEFVDEFTLSSIAISGGEILDSYKCETKVNGVEASIPLSWSNVPDSTGSLAVIMHSYPNPSDTSSVNSYLLLWDIDPSVTGIAHGEADDGNWFMGANKDGVGVSYTSPCSPGAGTHEYTITVYALSQTPSSLPNESTTDVDYSALKTAIDTVTTLGTATLTFNDVTE